MVKKKVPMNAEIHRESDEQQIVRLFEDGDRAIIAADAAGLARIYADDYIQVDESGQAITKQDMMNQLTSGEIRYISMTSTGRRILLPSKDVAIVHGSEDDVVEQGGKRFPVSYVYLDVVVKRNGKWQIVGSQLARPAEHPYQWQGGVSDACRIGASVPARVRLQSIRRTHPILPVTPHEPRRTCQQHYSNDRVEFVKVLP